MSSFFTTEQAAALAGQTVRMAWLAEFQFVSATKRIWSGDTLLAIGGNNWEPTRGYVQIEGLGFSGDASSQKITLSVSAVGDGLPADFLAQALAESDEADQQPLIVYMVLFDEDWQVSGGLIPIGAYTMQPVAVSRAAMDGGEGAVQKISIEAENAFYNRARPPFGRYTDRDQNKRTSTPDKFFEFTPSLTSATFTYPDF